ncbi:hypothetical protein EYY60_06860 [Flavobacterium zhairuonense]|uniref:hypothetical protein n=1 Tax=Flavobacterium zhairuonense TaxID=2493631 RepID=UPI0010435480|nr:hypothetical protein [Flavobacterium zhairuonense]KAF2512822.1 hypothetical protein EYY60_06860 [Flavobacterium zhairuonense]
MSLFVEIEKIKAQILDTEKILELVGDHPLMSKSIREKLNLLKNKLEKYPKNSIEPRLRLLFSGSAVKGSIGIKSKFVSKTINPIQELIKTQTALVRFGDVGKRGRIKKSKFSDLYLTALPTGSFGVELSKLEFDNLFDENDVAIAINQVMELISATTTSDEAFEEAIENTPKRNLANLKTFLKQIDEENSILKIESGSYGINISEEQIHNGFKRVNLTESDNEDIFINGVLRGFLLDSGKFEITTEDGKTITGIISPDLNEEQILEYDKKFLNKSCIIHLNFYKTIFTSGKEKISYELLEILDLK